MIDQWGGHSLRQPFAFAEGENEKTIAIEIGGYWKYAVLVPKFTSIKKLPYEYGFISLKGSEVSPQLHLAQHLQSLAAHLTKQLNTPLTAIIAEPRGARVSVLAKLEDAAVSVEEISRRATQLSIGSSVGEAVAASILAERQEIAFLAPSELLQLLYPPGAKIEGVLRRIARSALFTFATFSRI